MAGRGLTQFGFAGDVDHVVRAVRVSADVASALTNPGFRGTVLAVHRSALTIAAPFGLLTVLRDAVGAAPGAITIAGTFAPRDAGVRAGTEVRGDGTVVRVGPVAVDLRGATRWDLTLRPMPAANPGLASRTARLVGAVERLQPPDDVLADRIAALRSAVGGAGDVRIAAAGLVGLGAGLTPSGDDVLVGCSAALTALGHPRARLLAADWAALAVGRTTPVAEAYLAHAARGAYAERLHVLLAAVLSGPLHAVPDAVASAAAWGASSGRDTLLGVRVGLEVATIESASRAA